MSIKSSTFGGVRLSGKDAEKFRNQITYGKPKKAAAKSAKRGSSMLKEYQSSGQVKISIK